MIRLVLLAALLAFAPLAAGAAPACRPPADLAPWPVQTPRPEEVSRIKTVFYVLTLSWAPEWCRTNGQGITAQKLECGRPRGFILHGLWPNGHGFPYPRYCTPVGGIDLATVRQMYCRTPSPELLQHEWQAHGGCGWTDPKVFFARSAALYDRVVQPPLEAIGPAALTTGAVRRAFIARNPWLSRDKIFVATEAGGRLTEVRLCYDLGFKPRSCPDGTGASDDTRLRLTPSLNGRF
jgi:ribonuclease T2